MPTCSRKDCGAEYRDDAGGRLNHRLLYDHPPVPERPRSIWDEARAIAERDEGGA